MKYLSLTTILLITMSQSLPANPLIVAHRGASKDAPENTIPAFELAWKQNADAIEGDFHLTSDGHIVCIHNYDTEKYTGQKLVVQATSLEKLRTLDVGSYHNSRFEGAVIPTIAEVFATIPEGGKIYIEVKCGREIVPTLREAIRNSGLKDDQIVVISFQEEVIREIKRQAPQFKACWLSGFKEDASGHLKPSLQTVLHTLKDIRADGFSSSQEGITEALIKGVQAEGYEYHVWTVDDAATARRFLDWGALSITTNVPGVMRSRLGL